MPPIVIAASIAAVGTVASAAISSSAASKAAQTQSDAAARTEAGIESRFQQTREDLAPWRETGAEALSTYAGLLGIGGEAPDTDAMQAALEKYPGYQFALSQGIEAVEKSASGGYGLQSGQALKDLTAYGQGLASSNFENYMNRLQGLSGGGLSAAAQTGAFGARAAEQTGLAGERGAEARATGYTQKADIFGGTMAGLSQIGGYLAKQDIWGSSGSYGGTGGTV